MQNTAKQIYTGLVTFHDAQPGNEVNLFYNAPETTLGDVMNNIAVTLARPSVSSSL